MLVSRHIIIGALVAIILHLFFPAITWTYSLIIFLSSVLIDVDHYVYYAVLKKDINFKRSYNWFMENREKAKKLKLTNSKNYQEAIFFLHGVEFMFILILLIFTSRLFAYVLIGIIIHMLLDFVDATIHGDSFKNKLSAVHTHIRNKKRARLS